MANSNLWHGGTLALFIALPGCVPPGTAGHGSDIPEVLIPEATALPLPLRDEAPEPAVAPPGMVLVPGGPFPRGCSVADPNCYANETPSPAIHIDAFAIDRLEITVADYRRCVELGACDAEEVGSHTNTQDTSLGPGAGSNSSTVLATSPSEYCNYPRSGRDDHPMNCVSHYQASAYCASLEKRLPTEAEWEKAARGVVPSVYPWGNEPPGCGRTVMREGGYGCGRDGTWPVGSKPAGRARSGALDMTGNVWEWVSDWYGDDYYRHSPDENPPGPETGIYRVVKGGGWADEVESDVNSLRISNRYSYGPELRFMHTGFRCAQ